MTTAANPSMNPIPTPVAIVGAGPAGAAASLFLSKAGIHHYLIDKETFPRDKICGDGCSGKTTYVLRQANPGFLDEIFADEGRFLPSYGVRFVAPNGRPMNIPFYAQRQQGQRPPGFTSKRLELDHFLFSKLDTTYATILQGCTVQQLERNEDGFQIVGKQKNGSAVQLQCTLLIGADGDKGITRKRLLQDNRVAKAEWIGLRGYYTGVQGMHPENFIELHFLKEVLPGYFWIFPLPNGEANVGIGLDAAVARRKKINLREVMLHTIAAHPLIRERFAQAQASDKIYGWGLPVGKGAATVSGDHFMITGDAASLIDSFTGEGIGNALYSGMVAAEAAAKALEAKCADAAFLQQHYDKELFRRIGDELRISHSMQQLVRFPWLFNLVVNKAAKSPTLQQTLTSMFADLDIRAQLRKPSFYWKMLMNK